MIIITSLHPRNLQHTPISHTPTNPRNANYERSPMCSLLVKVARGVFQRCVETTLNYKVSKGPRNQVISVPWRGEPFPSFKAILDTTGGWNHFSVLVIGKLPGLS